MNSKKWGGAKNSIFLKFYTYSTLWAFIRYTKWTQGTIRVKFRKIVIFAPPIFLNSFYVRIVFICSWGNSKLFWWSLLLGTVMRTILKLPGCILKFLLMQVKIYMGVDTKAAKCSTLCRTCNKLLTICGGHSSEKYAAAAALFGFHKISRCNFAP